MSDKLVPEVNARVFFEKINDDYVDIESLVESDGAAQR